MQNTENKQKIVITDRRQVDVEGVSFVTLVDEQQICIDTVKGALVVEGTDLKLENLEKAKGTVVVLGEIQGVYYVEKRHKNKGRR